MFLVHCKDKPNATQVRADNRPAHLEYLKGHLGKITIGGPIMNEERTQMVGSAFILDTTDRAEVESFLAGDPYGRAGLFESVTIMPFRKTVP